MSAAPSVTLYLSGLNYSAVPKQELRRSLFCLFSTYGLVLDVVHSRSEKVRGSAWVVFRDLASSTAAMRGLDGESFYGRGLRISYAKGTSYATVAHTEGPEAVYAIKLGLRDAEEAAQKGGKLTVSAAQRKLIADRKEKRAREDGGEEEEEEEEEEEGEEGPEKKKSRTAEQEAEEDDDAMMEESDDEDAPGPATAEQGSEPNPILFITGLPTEVTSEMLSTLFQQYPGLSTLTLHSLAPGAPKNSGTAFVQYDSAAQAGVAKEALDGFLVDKDAPMGVSWAKRA